MKYILLYLPVLLRLPSLGTYSRGCLPTIYKWQTGRP